MNARRRGGPGRARGERGSIIVEFALVLPLLLMLVLGVIEFGTVHRNRTMISEGARSAARIESQAGNSVNPNPSADLYALTTFASATSSLVGATLLKVVIYKSTTVAGTVPAACLTATMNDSSPNGVAGVCNVYTPNQVAQAASGSPAALASFGCASPGTWDHQWCVSTRNATLAGADWVGIWVQFQYKNQTSLLPYSSATLTDSAVFRIEPSV